MPSLNRCPECLAKQREIDRLIEEITSLKDKLRYQDSKNVDGFFGSNTPSAKLPVKPNSEDKPKKKRGAKKGHKGHGRQAFDESSCDHQIDIPTETGSRCPLCGDPLQSKGTGQRSVIECRPLKAERIHYNYTKSFCYRCKKRFTPIIPGVLPNSLYGNQLMATAATMHYLHGVPLGRVCEQLNIGAGALVIIFHRMAKLFSGIIEPLTQEYRDALVKHADETGWRTEGKNGYVWLFATLTMSLFEFKKTRSAKVAHAIFGANPLQGVLLVDRYAGYNKVPCLLQYCYAHLLREVQDLEKDFADSLEIKVFVATLAPLLALAMGLRNQKISDKAFYSQAAKIKSQIIETVNDRAQHLAIRHIQGIFVKHEDRMYHWATNRDVPADNNLAERDLRPTVIARKVSFGSQSDAGAHTRSVLMSVLYTMKKRGLPVAEHLKQVLDSLAKDIHQNPYPLFFPSQ